MTGRSGVSKGGTKRYLLAFRPNGRHQICKRSFNQRRVQHSAVKSSKPAATTIRERWGSNGREDMIAALAESSFIFGKVIVAARRACS